MNEKGNHTARKRAEEALRRKEEDYRTLAENSPDLIARFDRQLRHTYVNPAAARAGRLSTSEYIGKTIPESGVPEPAAGRWEERIRQVLETGQLLEVVDAFPTPDGIRYFNTRFIPELAPDGSVQSVLSVARDITERRQAEEALQYEKDFAEGMIKTAQAIVLVLDTQGRIVRFNPYMEEISGYALAEVQGKDWFSTFLPEGDRERIRNLFLEAINNIQTRGNVNPILAKDGRECVIEWYDKTLRDGHGNVVGLLAIGQDITARKRAEEELRRLIRTLKMVTACNQALVRATEEAEFLYKICLLAVEVGGYRLAWVGFAEQDLERTVRPAAQAGYEQGYLKSVKVSWSEDTEWGRGPTGTAIRTGKPAVCINTLTDPAYAPWREEAAKRGYASSIALPLLSEGRVMGALNIYAAELEAFSEEEVSLLSELADDLAYGIHALRTRAERKRAEEALTDSEEKYRLVVQNASQGIVVLQAGMLKFINSWACEFMAYPESEMLGKPFLSFVHPGDRGLVAERYEKRLKGEPAPQVYSFRLVGRTGRSSWVEVSATRVLWEGQPAALAFLSDITERKRLEEQVLQLQKMEAVGRLAGGVAHDYNNLLQVIMGYGEMLEKRLPTDNPLRKYVEGIQKAADRAASLTQQLLAFSRRQVVLPAVLDLSRAVAEAGKMLRRLIGEDIEMTTELAPDLGRVRADMVQVEQMIMNLALNARDAMPQGGKLTLRTANVVLDEAFTASRLEVSPGPYVLLEVSDTGHGMDESTLAHIFEPFFTTREKGRGTGLGLSMVYGIVKQSGGHIEVESAPGKGATFKVYFPRIEEEEQQRKSAPAEAALSGGTETVLLVEDEPEIRGLIREVLSAQGYSVLEAGNGDEALKLSGELPGPIHLLLTDVVMPGMSGRDLAQRLAALRPDMKLLFMSGYTDDAIIRHGLLVEKLAFLQKPFRPEALLRKVRETLDAS